MFIILHKIWSTYQCSSDDFSDAIRHSDSLEFNFMENVSYQTIQTKQGSVFESKQFQNSYSSAFSQNRLTPNFSRRSRLELIRGDNLNRREKKLAQLVNQYRQRNNLPKINLSKALTIVANRHVQDLATHGFKGSLHGWSNAPYDRNKPSTYPSMWLAPKRLGTRYPGYGYENAYASFGRNASAQSAFNAWKNSPAHNAVLLSQGGWRSRPWKALGVGIYRGYAVMWVGEERDPTGKPAQT